MMALSELSEVVKGQLQGEDATFAAVSTDTRTINPGDVFFALRGERFNAADFVAQAAEKGAAGVVVDAPVDIPVPQIQVADTRIALADFARAWRAQSDSKLIGITGSNGKTTVKELTAAICRVAFGEDRVLATQGNLNNDIGLPLTLLNLRDNHAVAVV
ncbi:MAG: UDP-N-acetylmuramoyl-tripeptide--D-alanyl-D-alanine ligase, partial [Gammaproteobacteria bacterium]|nr:UDP-N-acetylmuramoyl-tripeptide--D-alanyl-D-alanine ligase [Gammaproteobacteria bacterium]